MESVLAALVGYLVPGERLTSVQLVGSAVIVIAAVRSQLGAWGRITNAEDHADHA